MACGALDTRHDTGDCALFMRPCGTEHEPWATGQPDSAPVDADPVMSGPGRSEPALLSDPHNRPYPATGAAGTFSRVGSGIFVIRPGVEGRNQSALSPQTPS